MKPYLAPSKFIDFNHPDVARKAHDLAGQSSTTHDLIKRCCEFVRDQIKHSADFKLNPVTSKASDVLRHGTGYCYAKSHLLAALLRANGVPTGLCYQRLSVQGQGAPYCLHGLNAVWLPELGWHRIDARGNKPGVNAQFAPPLEALAFPVLDPHERDLPEVWAEPLPVVIAALTQYTTHDQVLQNLPDIELWAHSPSKDASCRTST
jgi:transglutaminase-like putative cysteine protease